VNSRPPRQRARVPFDAANVLLQELVGLPFVETYSILNTQCFLFGEYSNLKAPGERRFRAPVVMQIECPWKIGWEGQTVASSDDWVQVVEDDESEGPDCAVFPESALIEGEPAGPSRHERLELFFRRSGQISIAAAKLLVGGGIEIVFSNQSVLGLGDEWLILRDKQSNILGSKGEFTESRLSADVG
jgi:hypothetical protein